MAENKEEKVEASDGAVVGGEDQSIENIGEESNMAEKTKARDEPIIEQIDIFYLEYQ